MLRIGMVGCGHIAKHRHIPIFRKIKGVEVSAICDTAETVAQGVARQFGIKHAYSSFSEMLKKENLHIVDITTPPQTHVSVAVEAMEAGCHVLVEKPLAMTVKEVDEVFQTSEKQKVKLCVVHQNLFNPAVRRAKQLVEEGIVGDLISVDVGTFVRRDNYMCVNGNHWCHRLPGGIFFEILPHPVYLMQVFLKKPSVSYVLSKKLGNFPWMKTDETRVLMKASNGISLIAGSCNSPYHGDSIDIFGTKMSLQVDLWGRTVIKHKPRTENPYSVGKNNLSLAFNFLTLVGATVSNSLSMATGGVKVSAHYGFLNEFIRSVEADGKLPVTREEARENVSIVQSICEGIDKAI